MCVSERSALVTSAALSVELREARETKSTSKRSMRSVESMAKVLFVDRIAPRTIKHDIVRQRERERETKEGRVEGTPGAYIGLIPHFQAIGNDQ